MITTLERKPGNSIELTLLIPWSHIEATYKKMVESLIAQVELPGFRKGKAPKDLAEKHLDRTKVYEEVVREIIPKAYTEAVTEHKLQPIINPQIELVEAQEGKDWKVKVVTAEKPRVNLGDYRKAIANLHAEKKNKIWVPGQTKPTDEKKETGPTVAEVLDTLNKAVTVEIAPVIIENEVNRMLSGLLNETQKLGLTVDSYLQAQQKTKESLRAEYEAQAQKTLTLEFALEEIAEQEKVTISEAEVDEVVKNAKTESEKTELSKQKYYLASLLRRQKTLNSLLSPAVVSA